MGTDTKVTRESFFSANYRAMGIRKLRAAEVEAAFVARKYTSTTLNGQFPRKRPLKLSHGKIAAHAHQRKRAQQNPTSDPAAAGHRI